MNALQTSYEAKLAQYNALVAEGNPAKLATIQKINGELAAMLHSMLEALASAKKGASKLTMYRDTLMTQLVGIQNDATIMRQQRDQYATLEMLQKHDQLKFNTTFFWYAISLGIAALLFVCILMWKGGYKAPTIPTITSSPNTMDALT